MTGGSGFALGLSLRPLELARTKALIVAEWLRRLREFHPELASEFASRGIERYHECADRVDHARLWPKRFRLLPPAAVAEVRQTSLVRALEEAFGPFEISDEDRFGWEEVYWRLVRPGEASDVGPLHADRWFADVGDEDYPPDRVRVKVWIAIVCEPGRNGLQVVPGSHQREWRFHAEQRGGSIKPQIDEDVDTLDAQLLPTAPGDAVVFGEELLHGGVVNRGEHTRVSLEFTMLVREGRV